MGINFWQQWLTHTHLPLDLQSCVEIDAPTGLSNPYNQRDPLPSSVVLLVVVVVVVAVVVAVVVVVVFSGLPWLSLR